MSGNIRATYQRGLEVLAKQRPASARAATPNAAVQAACRKYGPPPTRDQVDAEGGYLNETPTGLRVATMDIWERASARSSPLGTPGLLGPSPPVGSRPTSSGGRILGSPESPSKTSQSNDATSLSQSDRTAGSAATGPVGSAWTTQDETHEITLAQLAMYMAAARRAEDEASPEYVSVDDDPVAALMRPQDVTEPTEQIVLDVWRDIVGNEKLELLRKRICALCGVSRLLAIQIIAEIESITIGITEGTLNRDRLKTATHHMSAAGLVAAVRESVTSFEWTDAAEAAWRDKLKLLSK